MKIIQGAAIALVTFVITIFAAEVFLSWRRDNHEREWAEKVVSYYPWAVYTSSGERVGSKRGFLKLMLRPIITYGNYPDQRTPYFTINNQGFRGEPIEKARNSRRRFILVGGSTAFGTGVKGDSETISSHLQNESEAEVLNAAVIGHQSSQQAAYFTSELIDYSPDVLIAFDGWNDFRENRLKERVVQTGDTGFYQIEQQLLALTRVSSGHIFDRLTGVVHTSLFPSLSNLVSRAVKKGSEYFDVANDSEADGREDVAKAAAQYVENHARLDRICRALNIPYFVFIQPDIRVVELLRGRTDLNKADREFAEGYLQFSQLAKDGLQRAGVAVTDMHQFNNVFERENFMDSIHMETNGNLKAARIIGDVIGRKASISAETGSSDRSSDNRVAAAPHSPRP